VWAYKGLLDLTGIEPVTTRVADLRAGADSALCIQRLQLFCGGNFRENTAEESASAIDAVSAGHCLWAVPGQGNAGAEPQLCQDGFITHPSQLCNFPPRKDKGKAIPIQAWTDPVVSRSLRLPDFKTFGT
jgi:hypothetical protein